METDIGFKLISLVLLLGGSAFFSSVESALFSISRVSLEKMRQSPQNSAKRVANLLDDPKKLLATILTGNTLVNISFASISTLLAIELANLWGVSQNIIVPVNILLVSAVILLLGELLPKLLALKKPEDWAMKTSSLLKIFVALLYPLAYPIAYVAGVIARVFGIKQQSMLSMTEDEIRSLVQVGHTKGTLEYEERKMIHSIFEFGDTIVREVMVPRIDVVAIESKIPLKDLLQLVMSKGHSRIPVYVDTIDNITGIIYAKDLLKVWNTENFKIENLLRTAYYVPEEKKIDELLREFQKEKYHMAIVVDEYGGVAGIVTMEDIIEEIVGEIQDEYDFEQPSIKQIDDDTIVALGRLVIYDFNHRVGHDLIPESESYDTLAGFVFSQLGHVPKKGETFEFKGHSFIVEEIHGKRIIRLRVKREKSVLEGA